MARITCQSRVVNLSDPRVIHEKRRDLMGVLELALNPQISVSSPFNMSQALKGLSDGPEAAGCWKAFLERFRGHREARLLGSAPDHRYA